jgi:PAS domain S-box-containing protein
MVWRCFNSNAEAWQKHNVPGHYAGDKSSFMEVKVESLVNPEKQSKSIATRYALALLVALIGLQLREMLSPYLGAANPYHVAWAVVAFSAWYLGPGPATLTTFISMFGVWYWFLSPHHSFAFRDQATEIPGMIGFLVFSGFIVVLGETSRRTNAKLKQEIAGRLHARQKLTEKEKERFVANERLRALMTALPVGVSFSDDRTCQNITGNPAALAQFDARLDDNLSASALDPNAVGRQLRFFQNGRELSNAELPLQRAVGENREIAPMEFEVQMPSGRRWVMESSGAPIHDAKGNVVGGVAVHIDVTDRKQADEALRVSEERYRLLAETMLFGVVHQDEDGRIVAMNPAATQILGWGDDGFLGSTSICEERYAIREDGSTFPCAEHPATVALRTGKPSYGVVMGVFNSQTHNLRWIKVDSVPSFRPGRPTPFQVYTVFEEITERKRAEAALRESEERFRAFFEQATVGIASVSIDGRYLDANRKFCDLLGRPREQVLQMTITQATHPDYVAADREQLRKLLAGDASQYNVEKLYVRGDGSYVWAASTVFPLRNADGSIKGFAKVIEDISIRKQVEMELARERSALESRVEERTHQLEKTIKHLNIQAAEKERAEASIRALSARLLQLQDEERRRIARELHDSAGQTLAALDMQLSIIQMKTRNMDGDLMAAVADSVSLVHEASRGIRTMSYLLHPPLLDEAGLASPLQWFVEGFAERSGIQVELKISQRFGRLPHEMELTFFRLVQEGLTNVHRHSGSPTAQVELNRSETEVTLMICDQGKGFSEPSQNQSSQESYKIGVGIRGMRERVHQLGGTMEFLNGRPGTILKVTLPLSRIRGDERPRDLETATLKTTQMRGNGDFARD